MKKSFWMMLLPFMPSALMQAQARHRHRSWRCWYDHTARAVYIADLGFDYSYIMAATADRVPCVFIGCE